MALETAHAPFLRPLKVADELVFNHALRELGHGHIDSLYVQGYKFFPARYIFKGIKFLKKSLGVGKNDAFNPSKRMSEHWLFKKLNIKIDDNLAEEVVKNLGKIYDPEYLKSVNETFRDDKGNLLFFSRAMHGDGPYYMLAEHIIDEAMNEFRQKAISVAFGGAEEALNSINNVAEGEATGEPSVQENNTKKETKKTTNTPKTTVKNGKSVKQVQAEMAKAKTGREKAQIAAKYGIDTSFDAAANVATKAGNMASKAGSAAGNAVKTAKTGVQKGVKNVTKGTKNLNFGTQQASETNLAPKKETSGILGQVTDTLSGLFKNLPIPGLGGA